MCYSVTLKAVYTQNNNHDFKKKRIFEVELYLAKKEELTKLSLRILI